METAHISPQLNSKVFTIKSTLKTLLRNEKIVYVCIAGPDSVDIQVPEVIRYKEHVIADVRVILFGSLCISEKRIDAIKRLAFYKSEESWFNTPAPGLNNIKLEVNDWDFDFAHDMAALVNLGEKADSSNLLLLVADFTRQGLFQTSWVEHKGMFSDRIRLVECPHVDLAPAAFEEIQIYLDQDTKCYFGYTPGFMRDAFDITEALKLRDLTIPNALLDRYVHTGRRLAVGKNLKMAVRKLACKEYDVESFCANWDFVVDAVACFLKSVEFILRRIRSEHLELVTFHKETILSLLTSVRARILNIPSPETSANNTLEGVDTLYEEIINKVVESVPGRF